MKDYWLRVGVSDESVPRVEALASLCGVYNVETLLSGLLSQYVEYGGLEEWNAMVAAARQEVDDGGDEAETDAAWAAALMK